MLLMSLLTLRMMLLISMKLWMNPPHRLHRRLEKSFKFLGPLLLMFSLLMSSLMSLLTLRMMLLISMLMWWMYPPRHRLHRRPQKSLQFLGPLLLMFVLLMSSLMLLLMLLMSLLTLRMMLLMSLMLWMNPPHRLHRRPQKSLQFLGPLLLMLLLLMLLMMLFMSLLTLWLMLLMSLLMLLSTTSS